MHNILRINHYRANVNDYTNKKAAGVSLRPYGASIFSCVVYLPAALAAAFSAIMAAFMASTVTKPSSMLISGWRVWIFSATCVREYP
jgi:hypothetical protein